MTLLAFASHFPGSAVPKDSLTVIDNRTGKQYELPIQDGTIHATDLRQIQVAPDNHGLLSYDPAFMNTAACRSAISFIDGDKGILRYRGYPIEQLAEKSTFLETAYLLLHGELPSASELDRWVFDITHHTIIHENIKKFIDGFHHDAHPLAGFVSPVAHEQTCWRGGMRGAAWAHADRYSAMAAAAVALYGPLHGGANEQVLRMLHEIGTKENIPAYIQRVKNGEVRLMGFGHRIYKNYDPRAKIIKQTADQVFDLTGKNPLIDIALELERIALQDEYFVSRKLYPNVDFYSGIIYEAMKFPIDMFPVLFAIGRTPGWLAQWQEMLLDKEQKIARPRQVYIGSPLRDYVTIEKR